MSQRPQNRHLKKGGQPGRPKGQPNIATREMKALARQLTTENPKYVAKLRQRLESGRCHPTIEAAMLYYGHGKPKETVKVEAPNERVVSLLVVLQNLSTDTLRDLKMAYLQNRPAIEAAAVPVG